MEELQVSPVAGFGHHDRSLALDYVDSRIGEVARRSVEAKGYPSPDRIDVYSGILQWHPQHCASNRVGRLVMGCKVRVHDREDTIRWAADARLRCA